MHRERNHPIAAGLLLAFLTACGAPQESKVKDEWDPANNPVTMMANSYSFETRYEALPLRGRPELVPWSDNYWPTYQGGIAYRWNWDKSDALSELESKSTDEEFAGQLDENPELQKLRSEVYGYSPYTKDQLLAMPEADREALIRTLSPAEKYDIYRGAFDYPTVKSERQRTGIMQTLRDQPFYDKDKKIETWFGICHAWAPATIMFKEPGPLSIESKDKIKVDFGASDIKALLSHMIDVDSSQMRFKTFMGNRCNSDISQDNVNRLNKDIFGELEHKNNDKVEAAIKKLLDDETIDVSAKMGLVPYILAYSDTEGYAKGRFTQLSANLGRYVKSSQREDFQAALAKAPEILALAGTEQLTSAERLEGIKDAVRTKSCSDTNAGAFHLALANIVGLQKQSFVADITRDREVWNQAVAGYSSKQEAVYTGDQISDKAAPGTVKEVEISTTFYYTGEMAPAWQAFGDGSKLDSRYHHPLKYRYRLELDNDGHIIGGSWVSESRPDFLWGAANVVFSPEFTELKRLYYKAIHRT